MGRSPTYCEREARGRVSRETEPHGKRALRRVRSASRPPHGDWADLEPAMADEIKANPEAFRMAAQAQSPIVAMETLYNRVKQRDWMTEMKVNAQTARGADRKPAPFYVHVSRFDEM